MKSLLLIFAALPLLAQEPAAPPVNEPSPEKPDLPAPTPRDDKLLDLFRKNPTPEPQQAAPKKAQKADPAKSPKPDPSRDKARSTLLPPSTSNDLDLRIRYRKARTVAERDPAVIAAWDASRAARTDYAKRAALTRYYELLRAKVLSVDRGVASVLNERHAFTMKRLVQTRVAATQPIAGTAAASQANHDITGPGNERDTADSIDEDSVRNQ